MSSLPKANNAERRAVFDPAEKTAKSSSVIGQKFRSRYLSSSALLTGFARQKSNITKRKLSLDFFPTETSQSNPKKAKLSAPAVFKADKGQVSSVVKSTILPSKKDTKPIAVSSFNRQTSTATTVSSELSSNTGGGGSEANRAFDSLSSETLRQVIGSTIGDNNVNDEGGARGEAAKKKQPLAASRVGQNQQPNFVSSVAKKEGGVKPSSSSSSSSSSTTTSNAEPITIIEHRKRPCGDGYTVHTDLRGKLLGKGGFAKVYKVTSLDTNKEYAVKIVPKANLVKSRARQKVSTSRIVAFADVSSLSRSVSNFPYHHVIQMFTLFSLYPLLCRTMCSCKRR